MAEGTRLKDLQEAQKRIDQILQTESMKREATELKLQEQISGINSEMQDQMMGLNGKYEHLTNTLASIQLQLLNMNKGKGTADEESILGGPYPVTGSEGTYSRIQHSPRNRVGMEQQGMQVISPLPKIDFPKFDGSHPRSWILKCNGYFKLIPNIPDHQKVVLASMHFEGKAAQWFQNFSSKHVELSWNQFIEVVSARFEELKEARIIAEFNKLKHSGSYAEYVERFEELRACMLVLNNRDYSEAYFIASFISGLSEELQAFMNMFEPSSLQQTVELGRKQLLTLEAITRKVKGSTKLFSAPYPRRPAVAPLQEATARRLGCPLESAKPLLVKVANGQRLVSSQKATDFSWDMQGYNFTYSLRLLENEGCDLILGGDWLKSCTPIELDYDKMTFTVNLKGRRVKIQALTSAAQCQFISEESLYKLLHYEGGSQIEELYVINVKEDDELWKLGRTRACLKDKGIGDETKVAEEKGNQEMIGFETSDNDPNH
ncbi:hypothetical protein DH2020_046708 [Rehmannia glutinosa]|uniref:Ty3 transposon capsid-like protein domain-containing protein n=1 Tax=Rehmannia glutinosa TaxID=99300 RepID=A0ABR0UAN0_REHGL